MVKVLLQLVPYRGVLGLSFLFVFFLQNFKSKAETQFVNKVEMLRIKSAPLIHQIQLGDLLTDMQAVQAYRLCHDYINGV